MKAIRAIRKCPCIGPKEAVMKKMAVKGNATTTGGEVLDGDETALDDGRPVAGHMHLASCPRCGKNGPIFGMPSARRTSGPPSVRCLRHRR
jgi:uncharacterized Zn-binding protein involved in type VI secretion